MSSILSIVCVVGLVACSSATKSTSESQVEDVTNVVTDSVTFSSEERLTRGEGETESEGFGRCLERGCYCKEFKGRGQTCQNCGHAYKRHY